jgi:RNase adaptor protein for sRNA GlmZ degradation
MAKVTNNGLQNMTQKTKDRVARTLPKIGYERRCFGRVGSSCSTGGTHRVTLVSNLVISYE